jgi:hypothetical protein
MPVCLRPRFESFEYAARVILFDYLLRPVVLIQINATSTDTKRFYLQKRGTLIAGSRDIRSAVCRRMRQLDNRYFFGRRRQHRFACRSYPSYSRKDYCACNCNCQFETQLRPIRSQATLVTPPTKVGERWSHVIVQTAVMLGHNATVVAKLRETRPAAALQGKTPPYHQVVHLHPRVVLESKSQSPPGQPVVYSKANQA